MGILTDLAGWLFHTRMELWTVVLSAVVLAWLERGGQARRQREYDAWWFHNLPRTATKAAARRSKPGRRRRHA